MARTILLLVVAVVLGGIATAFGGPALHFLFTCLSDFGDAMMKLYAGIGVSPRAAEIIGDATWGAIALPLFLVVCWTTGFLVPPWRWRDNDEDPTK